MLNFLLKPCIFVYRVIRSFFYGIYSIIYSILLLIYKFCYFFLYGITLPVRVLLNSLKKEKSSTKKIEKEEMNQKKIQQKEQSELLRKEKKEKARIKKEEIRQKKIQQKEQRELLRKEKKEKARVKKEEIRQKKIQQKEQRELLRKEKKEKARVEKEEIRQKKIQQKEQRELLRKEKKEKARVKKEEIRQKKIQQKEQRKLLRKEKKENSPKYIKKQQKKAELKEKKQKEIEQKKAKKEKALEEKKQAEIKRIHDKNLKREQKAFEATRKRKEKEEQRRILKEKKEKAKKEKIERKQKIEKRRKNDTYINEKAKIKKTTFSEKIKNVLKSINALPAIILDKLKNNSFAKNRRNKKDINRQALLIDFNAELEPKSDVKLLYKYEAKDKNGNMVVGYFEAFSRVEVHSFLLSEGYEVYSIKTNKWITLFHGQGSVNRTKFKTKDLIFLLTQLSTYLKAGIPLVESLRILSKQFKKNKAYSRIFKSMIYELTMGESFSSAMSKQGKAFPKILINMVKTSEMTGELPEVLDDMSEYFAQSEETRKQMISALTYPSIVFVFAIGVITFVLLYVVPKFSEMYSSMDESKIPAFTKAVISISIFLKTYMLYIVLVLIVLAIIFIICYKKIKTFRTVCQWISMHIPVIGTTMIYKEVTMFTKTFSSLLTHNVSITECMELLNGITNNEIYKMLILDTITNLAKGGKISDAFEDHWAFPIPAYEMIVTGERTGELAEMMSKVSIYYQGLHKEMVSRIKTFIEPILTVFLTVMVGTIVLAIVIPMFNMYQTVSSM